MPGLHQLSGLVCRRRRWIALAVAPCFAATFLWYLYGVICGRPIAVLRNHSSVVEDVVFSPDGELLAVAAWGQTLRLWDIETGRLRREMSTPEVFFTRVIFSPDGRTLAGVALDGSKPWRDRELNAAEVVALWDVSTGKFLGVVPRADAPDWVNPMPMIDHQSPDGSIRVAIDDKSGFYLKTLTLQATSFGGTTATILHPDNILCARFSAGWLGPGDGWRIRLASVAGQPGWRHPDSGTSQTVTYSRVSLDISARSAIWSSHPMGESWPAPGPTVP